MRRSKLSAMAEKKSEHQTEREVVKPRASLLPGDLSGFRLSSIPSIDENDVPTEEKVPTLASLGGEACGILTVLSGFNAGQVQVLAVGDCVVGRGQDADFWVDDAGVSRKHSRFIKRGDSFYVEDLGSTNGTFVDSQKVVGAQRLGPSHRVQLGASVQASFEIVDVAQALLRKRLYDTSTRDALTGVYTRKYFLDRLPTEIAYARRHRSELALLGIDIDHFKKVNDTHGHAAGDAVLRGVADRLLQLIRIEDVLVRFGGEEFFILARTTEAVQSGALAERIRRAIEIFVVPFELTPLSVTLSIGACNLSEVASGDAEEFLRIADTRMYTAKQTGRNRVCFKDPLPVSE